MEQDGYSRCGGTLEDASRIFFLRERGESKTPTQLKIAKHVTMRERAGHTRECAYYFRTHIQ
jgi:phage anti-repressor protein